MPNASVDIGGNASGGLAAVAAMQGAIDGLTGTTVHLGVETSGGAALSGMARDMGNMANAAGRANRAAKSMGDHFERAGKVTAGMGGGFARAGAGAERVGRAARSMGEDFGRAGGHVATMVGHAERLSNSMRAIEGGSASTMRAIASGASSAGRGMRELEAGGKRVAASISPVSASFRGIEASATSAGRSLGASAGIVNGMKAIEGSAGRAEVAVRKAMSAGRGGGSAGPGIMDLRRQADGSFGLGGPIAAIEAPGLSGFTGQARAGKPPAGGNRFAGMSQDEIAAMRSDYTMSADDLATIRAARSGAGGRGGAPAGRSTPPRGSSHQYEGASERIGQLGDEQEERAGSQRTRRPGSSRTGSSLAGGMDDAGRSARATAAGVDEVGKSSERAGGSARSMMSALASGASPHHIERMIRPLQEAGFQLAMVGGMMAGVTREAGSLMDATTGMGLNFKGMAAGITQAEQSAARSHNLGLNGLDQELRQSARAMTNELAPAMRAGVGATKAFEEAKMGAQASMGPELEGFANQLKQSAPALQSIMGSVGKAALGLGTDVVAGLAQAGPAFASMTDTVAKNAAPLTQAVAGFSNLIAGTVQAAAATTGWLENTGNSMIGAEDKALGTKRDSSGAITNGLGVLDNVAAAFGNVAGGGLLQSTPPKAAVAPGAFDPSKPFSGTAVMPDGSLNAGTGNGAATAPAPFTGAPRSFSDLAKAGGGRLGAPTAAPRDDAWADGMTGKQVYESQHRKATGGYPSSGPMPSGLRSPGQDPGSPDVQGSTGARPGADRPRVAGFGSGARPIPQSIAGDLAQPMQAGAASGAQTAGGDLGGAMVNHVQKAVHVASAAATSGGQAIGGAAVGGIATGITTNQTVTDTAIIRHVKHTLDMAAGPAGIDAHSPSRKYDDLGRLIPQGLAQGVDRDGGTAFGAVQSMVGQAHTFGYEYANGGAPATVSVNRAAVPNQDPNADPNQAQLSPMQSTSSSSMVAPVNQFGAAGMANVQRHNNHAADLERGRQDNHAIAMANLGAMNPATGQKWQDPRANSNPLAGTSSDPSAKAGGGNDPLGKVKGLADQFHQSGLASTLGLEGMFSKAGQNSAMGLTQGMTAHIPKIQAAGAAASVAGVAGYRKKDQQSSPSAVWAVMGGNSIAGVPVGFAAGVPAAVSAIGNATAQMSAAIAGPLNNQGLMLGYSYATNVVTGATQVLKTANFQASGTPQIANQQAAAAVGRIGQLGMGAGSSVYKTPSVSMSGGGVAAQVEAGVLAAIQTQGAQGGGSSTQPIHIYLDSQLIQTMVRDGNNDFIEQLFDAHKGTNG